MDALTSLRISWAVLELWKWQRIDVRQQELQGPIMLERGPRWAEASVEEVEDLLSSCLSSGLLFC